MRLALALLLVACGNAEIIAPVPLSIVDTSPGNGSVIAPGETPVAILFSEDVRREQLQAAVRLEETADGGAPIRALGLALESYDRETFTAVLRTEPLPARTSYALTVFAGEIEGVSGARMGSDLIRRFRTSDE
jgi:hypothetical protein